MAMTEVRVLVQPIQVHLMCACGGEMRPNGMALPVRPARYVHICDRCGDRTDEPEVMYPYVEYEEVDVERQFSDAFADVFSRHAKGGEQDA